MTSHEQRGWVVASILLAGFIVLLGFYTQLDRNYQIMSDRAAEYQESAQFWRAEFDGCHTMDEAVPNLARQVAEGRERLLQCLYEQDRLNSELLNVQEKLAQSQVGLSDQVWLQIDAQIAACNSQYSCKICLWDTGNLSWCMRNVYDPR